ncbi:hypothetical protein FBU30_011319 [Linnemannia zychae]|nr:hypothetical protein FBU30_011319 [Linnemannia zychae]
MRTRPKYFHQLSPPPLDLPEIIDRIRADLTDNDLRKCTQVCTIWSRQFAPFLWETFCYSRYEQWGMKRKGHYVRNLVTFALRDNDLRAMTQCFPSLDGVTLEIEILDDPAALFGFYASVPRLKRLTLQLSDPGCLGSSQKALLFPIVHGAFTSLTKLQLIGMNNRRYAPVYQLGMIYRVLEACSLLEYIELSDIRIVDTMKQWDEAYQNSFSSPNSIPVPQRGSLAQRQSAQSTTSSWMNWGWNSKTQPRTHRHPAIVDDKESKANSEDSALYDANLLPEPNSDIKYQHLRTLKIFGIYSRQGSGLNFVDTLLKRSPKLTQLYLKSAPASISNLSTLCPELRLVSFQNYLQNQPYNQPDIAGYLSSPRGIEKLTTLRLEKCRFSAQNLQSVNPDFKRWGLKHLSVMKCEAAPEISWCQFIGTCEALETVSIDYIMFANIQGMTYDANNPVRTNFRQQRESVSSVIPWNCKQIRYLDVCGQQGTEAMFDYIFLVWMSKITCLEFLGMNTRHIIWLMKMEPLQISLEDPLEEPLPLGLFESVRTLSLESTNRRDTYMGSPNEAVLTLEQTQYMYHAFPALEKIVYNSTKFPCMPDAAKWLKQSPRKIEIFHRTTAQIEAKTLGL